MKKEKDLAKVTQMVKDLRDIAKTLLEISGLTEHELKMQLQNPEHYSAAFNEFLSEYRTKIALSMQEEGEKEMHDLLKKEDAQARAILHTWLQVK